MQAGRLECSGFVWLDFEAAFDAAHFHYAAVHGHDMDLTSALASLETQLTRSGALPVFVIVILAAPVDAPLGVARAHGWVMTIEPTR